MNEGSSLALLSADPFVLARRTLLATVVVGVVLVSWRLLQVFGHALSLGDSVGVATLLVTAVTLRVVLNQLDVARLEFKVVSEDVQRNAVLFERANRRSKLYVYGRFDAINWIPDLKKTATFLRLKLLNCGEIADSRYRVVVAFHKMFELEARNIELGKWKPVLWHPLNAAKYRNFRLYAFAGDEAVYPDDYIDLPSMVLTVTLAEFDPDKRDILIFGRVSSDFEQNPPKRDFYYMVERTRSETVKAQAVKITAESAEVANYYRTD